jgi:hypothetical protein
MSRKANCWDNAPAESLIATIKKELVHHQAYLTRAEARQYCSNTSKSSTAASGGTERSTTKHPTRRITIRLEQRRG